MKHLKTIILTMMVMFAFDTSVSAQVETKVNQKFSVYGSQGWRKYFYPGTPVTMFAYKKKDEIYKFGFLLMIMQE